MTITTEARLGAISDCLGRLVTNPWPGGHHAGIVLQNALYQVNKAKIEAGEGTPLKERAYTLLGALDAVLTAWDESEHQWAAELAKGHAQKILTLTVAREVRA